MTSRVQKWGNSLGLRIPKAFVLEAGLAPGTEVSLTVQDGRLVIAPIARDRFALDALIAEITPANLHGSAWDDQLAGKEWNV